MAWVPKPEKYNSQEKHEFVQTYLHIAYKLHIVRSIHLKSNLPTSPTSGWFNGPTSRAGALRCPSQCHHPSLGIFTKQQLVVLDGRRWSIGSLFEVVMKRPTSMLINPMGYPSPHGQVCIWSWTFVDQKHTPSFCWFFAHVRSNGPYFCAPCFCCQTWWCSHFGVLNSHFAWLSSNVRATISWLHHTIPICLGEASPNLWVIFLFLLV